MYESEIRLGARLSHIQMLSVTRTSTSLRRRGVDFLWYFFRLEYCLSFYIPLEHAWQAVVEPTYGA